MRRKTEREREWNGGAGKKSIERHVRGDANEPVELVLASDPSLRAVQVDGSICAASCRPRCPRGDVPRERDREEFDASDCVSLVSVTRRSPPLEAHMADVARDAETRVHYDASRYGF